MDYARSLDNQYVVDINEENVLQEKCELECHNVDMKVQDNTQMKINANDEDAMNAQNNKMDNMLERLRRFSVDSIKSEVESDTEIEYLNKFTSEVFLGYSSDSDASDLDVPEIPHKIKEQLKDPYNLTKLKTSNEHSDKVENRNSFNESTKDLNIADEVQNTVDNVNTVVSIAETTTNKILECHLCDKQFSHMTFLKKHILKHNSKFCVSCLICNKTISDPDTLQAHMGLHFDEKQFICQSCGKTFRRCANLLRHEPICRLEKKPVEQLCTLCGKLCQSKWQLQQHMMYHSDERPFPCGYCAKSFRFKSRLHEHERTHLGIKPHLCSFCNKAFTTSSDLNKHLKRHQKPDFKGYNTENNPNKLSMCKICNKKVVNLKTHMHLHYERGSDTCNICGTPKTLNQLYPQAKSSPGLTSLQTKPLKKPETKFKLKTKKLKCKDPEKAKPESSQPWMDVSKFTPNIKNESKITKQSYEAWVNTTPAAVMKQIQRIKAENAQQNRVSPEKKCSPLRIRNLDVSDDRYKGKLKIFNKHTIAHLN